MSFTADLIRTAFRAQLTSLCPNVQTVHNSAYVRNSCLLVHSLLQPQHHNFTPSSFCTGKYYKEEWRSGAARRSHSEVISPTRIFCGNKSESGLVLRRFWR